MSKGIKHNIPIHNRNTYRVSQVSYSALCCKQPTHTGLKRKTDRDASIYTHGEEETHKPDSVERSVLVPNEILREEIL